MMTDDQIGVCGSKNKMVIHTGFLSADYLSIDEDALSKVNRSLRQQSLHNFSFVSNLPPINNYLNNKNYKFIIIIWWSHAIDRSENVTVYKFYKKGGSGNQDQDRENSQLAKISKFMNGTYANIF